MYLTSTEFSDSVVNPSVLNGLTPTQIDSVLSWASQIADSYIRKRFELPLSDWGEDLKSIVGDLAQFRLMSLQGFRPGSGNDEIAVMKYNEAIKWLRSVSKGELEPANIVDSTPSLDEEGPLTVTGTHKPFTYNTGGSCD